MKKPLLPPIDPMDLIGNGNTCRQQVLNLLLLNNLARSRVFGKIVFFVNQQIPTWVRPSSLKQKFAVQQGR